VRACGRILLPLADRIETITYDNGKEFASHAEIVAALGAKSYFAKPYHSWERGLNEHTNGLVRQYFPKGTDFSTLSNADVQRVEDKLNSAPQDTRLPNPKRGFPDGRLTRLLHFTVEWAGGKNRRPRSFVRLAAFILTPVHHQLDEVCQAPRVIGSRPR